jgi:hypothetical protein
VMLNMISDRTAGGVSPAQHSATAQV